jgi:hypothetical protein
MVMFRLARTSVGSTKWPGRSTLPPPQLVQRVADAHLGISLLQLVDERRRNALLQDEPARRGASLAGGADRTEEHRAERQLLVGVVHDDQRVVAAQLEQGASQPFSDHGANAAAHAAGTGGGDQRNAAVGKHPLAHLAAAANHEVENPADAVCVHHLVGDVLHGYAGQWRLGRRLPHHRVAADRSDRRVPGPDGHGEIECGDNADRAQRVPLLVHSVQRALGVRGHAEKLAGQTDGIVADVDHLLHLAEPFGDDLAHLQRDETAQRLFLLAQRVAELPNDLAPLRCRHHAPCRERGLCRLYDAFVVLRRRLQHARDRFFVGRVVRNDFGTRRLDPGTRAGAVILRFDSEGIQQLFGHDDSLLPMKKMWFGNAQSSTRARPRHRGRIPVRSQSRRPFSSEGGRRKRRPPAASPASASWSSMLPCNDADATT